MKIANNNFVKLKDCINGEVEGDIVELFGVYKESRNALSREIFLKEQKTWDELTANKDSKSLWGKIDWKGGFNNHSNLPIFEDLTTHFENLYKSPENELEKMEKLTSNVYIQELDQPISKAELDKAMKDMKMVVMIID